MASTKNNNRNTRTDTEKHNEKIMDKIREKENEKAKLGGFKASLRNCKNEIEATNRRYWRKKTYVNNYPIAREGVIRNKFEGNAADYISRDLQECAEIVSMLDAKMLSLNKAILEAKEAGEEEKDK